VTPVSTADRLQALFFLLVGTALIFGVASLLTGWPFRRSAQTYFVEFEETVLIEAGAPVKYNGVKKGKVLEVGLGERDRPRVKLAIDDDLAITRSTRAKQATGGLLGPYFIELTGSSRDAAALSEGSVIPTDQSTMRRILDAGTAGLENVNALADRLSKFASDENRERLEKFVDVLTRTLETVDRTVTEVGPDATRLAKRWSEVGEELRAALGENREGLRRLMVDGAAAAQEARRFLESGRLDRAADQAVDLMATADSELRSTGASLRVYLSENPVAPTLERAVAAIERLEKSAGAALGTFEGEFASVARGELASALRALADASRALEELSATLRNDPALLLRSSPRPERTPPPPGGGR